jgi:4'-phosphopantetheinyl transferase
LLPEAGLHIWRARLDEPGWPGVEDLPDGDRERAEGFLRPEPARRWVASRWALRITIAAYLDADPRAIELGTDANGKPMLSDDDPIRFNLSHSHDLALIGLARRREIGIDVERRVHDRDFPALARQGLDPDAVAAIREAPTQQRSDVFYEAWVRREAVAKCGGEGLAGPPAPGEMEVIPLDVGTGWAAAVALAGSGTPRIRCYERVP